jgi:hypothetical protein
MKHASILSALCLAAAVLGAAPAAAQVPEHVGEGSRVRVTAAPLHLQRREATITSFYADTVFVRVAGDSLVAIPRAALTRVEVPVGDAPRPIGRSALIGAGVGALAGGVLGVLCADPECPPHLVEITTAGGAGLGALLGAAAGALRQPREWDAVDVRRLSARPEARRGRSFALGLSIPTR